MSFKFNAISKRHRTFVATAALLLACFAMVAEAASAAQISPTPINPNPATPVVPSNPGIVIKPIGLPDHGEIQTKPIDQHETKPIDQPVVNPGEIQKKPIKQPPAENTGGNDQTNYPLPDLNALLGLTTTGFDYTGNSSLGLLKIGVLDSSLSLRKRALTLKFALAGPVAGDRLIIGVSSKVGKKPALRLGRSVYKVTGEETELYKLHLTKRLISKLPTRGKRIPLTFTVVAFDTLAASATDGAIIKLKQRVGA